LEMLSWLLLEGNFSWSKGGEEKLSGGEKVDEVLFVVEG
jgi:hypothetical protein